MTNAELIKQLRGCKDIEFCSDCPRMPNGIIEPCGIKDDAADALEADEKRIATYQSDVADLEKREKELNDVLNERARLITELQARIAELESEMKLNDKEFEKMASDATDFEADLHERISELEAQLPKEGEWIEDDATYCGADLSNYKCSLCGKIGGTWRRGLKQDELPPFCGSCGARMKGGQE